MFGTGFILFMLGASGITNQHGDLQMPCAVMVAAGLAMMVIGNKKRERKARYGNCTRRSND